MTSSVSHSNCQALDGLVTGRSGDSARPRLSLPSGGKRTAIRVGGLALGVAVLLASIEFVRRQGLDPWTWFADVWVLIAGIPAPFVILACSLKAAEVSLNAAAWKTVLRAAYPDEGIGFRQTLGVVQGGVGIFSVIPPKFGGFAVLGLYKAAFPSLSITGVLATRVVQGISSTILGTALLVIFGVANAGFGEQSGFIDRVGSLIVEWPLLAALLIALTTSLLVVLLRRSRRWLREFVAQMATGGAILRTPGRYVLSVMVPTLLAFALRWAVTGTLLLAFGVIPSLETLLRVNVSHGLARTVQVTPGGFGTMQAFDLVALRGIAPIDVIAAYSLSQAAILLVFNIAFGLVALTWAFGWDRTARLIRLPGRHVGTSMEPAAPRPIAG